MPGPITTAKIKRDSTNAIHALLRSRIDAAIADLATWAPRTPTSTYITTQADCRIEFHRINGMIDALEAIGGNVHGLWAANARAKQSAIIRCPESTDIIPNA